MWQLFGEGYKLTPAVPGDMPGRFLARERVRVTAPEETERELPVIGPADGRRLEGVQVRVSHQYVTRIHLMAGENCPFTEEDLFHVEK